MSTFELKGKKIAVIENGLISTYTMREGLMMHLLKEGCDVYILTHTNRFVPQVEKMGLKVINIGSGNLNPFKVARYIYDLRKALKKIKPDVCLTFSIRPAIWGNLITRQLRIPTITNITGVGPLFTSKNIVYRTARTLYRNALSKTKKVFFQNFDDMNLFIERKFVKSLIAERIPGSGIDFKKFSPIALKEKDSHAFIFLFIGRLIKDKGIFEYINAARITQEKISQCSLQCYGAFLDSKPEKKYHYTYAIATLD